MLHFFTEKSDVCHTFFFENKKNVSGRKGRNVFNTASVNIGFLNVRTLRNLIISIFMKNGTLYSINEHRMEHYEDCKKSANLKFCKKLADCSAIFNEKLRLENGAKAVQRSALCRSRRELSNEYLLANIGVDTAESPSKFGENIQYYSIVSLMST